MLQTLRDKTSGWIAFFILAAVSIPFAFFGINNYFEARTETFVAKVGEEEITPQEFRTEFDRYRAQIRQMQGEGFDESYFDQPTVKREVLDRMIDEELLAQAAQRSGASISDARLREEIQKVPAFQGMDGKFSYQTYQSLLSSQRETERSFEERVRRDLNLRELPVQVAASATVAEADVDRFIVLRDQKRDFRWALVPRQAAGKAPTDTEIAAYYEAHKDEFMTAEQVALEYVEVDAAQLSVENKPDEEALKARYEEQKSRYGQAEQRVASHILVKVDANADAAAQKAAQAKAADLAAQAKSGKDFAALAKASSDDQGSKAQGGDLGAIERGTMQPAFEDALFAMKEAGEVSDPVRSDEGYHVIQLREIKPEQVRPFEEVRAELEDELLESEREQVFVELSGKLIDKVFSDPNALGPTAESLGLELKHTPLFGREGGEGIAANPAVVRAAFSDPVLVEGIVSDAIDLGTNHIVVIRAEEHKPAVVRPLEEVRADIVARLTQEAEAERTKALAESLREELAGGAAFDAVAQKAGATVETATGIGRSALNLDATLVAKAFALPKPKSAAAPVRDVLELRPGDFALVEVTQVVDGDAKAVAEDERERVRTQLRQGLQVAESRALIAALRAETEVKIAEDRL
jgi:peptidyl-prolyl cis-trans isomerase D